MDVVALVSLLAMACLLSAVADCELVAAERASIAAGLFRTFLPEDLKSEARMSVLFEDWIRVHGKKDDVLAAEKDRRFLNFKDNLRFLLDAHSNETNNGTAAPLDLSEQELHKLADLSTPEFRNMYVETTTKKKKKKKSESTRQRSKTGRRNDVQQEGDVAAEEESIDFFLREKDGADVGVTEQGGCSSREEVTATRPLLQHTTKEDGEEDQSYQSGLSVELRDKWEIVSSSPLLRSDVVKFSNGTELQLFPSSEAIHKHVNETRRRLGDFQQCSPCTCCDRTRSWCIPTACCYNIRCNLQGLPFGLCSFVPISCTCFGCTS